MNLDGLQIPLPAEDIEWRVQSINKSGYATILAYKDARVDARRLDEVVGPLNWQRQHTRENHNCIVSIWDKDNLHWVRKEDTGTESNSDAQKGLASDSFKRACFAWGIGRELYDYPLVQVKLNSNEYDVSGKYVKQTYHLKLKEWKWTTAFEGKKIAYIKAVDEKGTVRFEWGGKPEPKITEAQLTRLFPIAKKAGIDDVDVFIAKCGVEVESKKDMTNPQYERVVDMVMKKHIADNSEPDDKQAIFKCKDSEKIQKLFDESAPWKS